MSDPVCGAHRAAAKLGCVLPTHGLDTDHVDGRGNPWPSTQTLRVQLGLYGHDGQYLGGHHDRAVLLTDARVRVTAKVLTHPGDDNEDRVVFELSPEIAAPLERLIRRVLHGGAASGPHCDCHEGQPPREKRP